MKLTAIIFLATLMHVSASVYSQNKLLTLKEKNTSMESVLKKIEKQSEFFFLYNNKQIDVTKKIDIEANGKLIEDVLKTMLDGTGIHYLIKDKQIVLYSGNDLKSIVDAMQDSDGVQKQQQQPAVSGRVTDEAGQPLPGVTVAVKGTTRGTVTNADGEYSITNIPEDATLQFSFVGMATQEVEVGNQTTIDVTMVVDAIGIEEVVAVGYGVQKKINLTGSVASISEEELEKRVAANPQNILQGKLPGLQVVQSSGQPGRDGALLRIRGEGTYSGAGNNPLILIDGVQGDLAILDPDNIESVTILKDAASASIYGARAANGVILVSTKTGQPGGFSLDYHGNYQIHTPTRLPDLVTNSADFMEYWNMAAEHSGTIPPFPQEDINAFRNAEGKNDPRYPNFDWVDYMVNPAPAYKHNLSANGGTEKTTYRLAFGFLDQDGVIGELHNFKKYNLRMNVNSKINKVITIGTNIGLSSRDITESNHDAVGFMLMSYGVGPNYTPYLSDGSGRFSGRYNNAAWHNRNPKAVEAAGSLSSKYYKATAQSYIDLEITNNLLFSVKGAVDFGYNFSKLHEHAVDNFFFSDNSYAHNNMVYRLGVNDNMGQQLLTTVYSTLNYNKLFGEKHQLSVLGGYNQEEFGSRYLTGTRTYFPTDNLKELNAGSSENQSTSGSYEDWALQSFFGRINYNYEEKYLFESNIRYDGTSRMHRDYRWGVFPSVSFGWRISEENFMSDVQWVDNLKFRGSWGVLGNQNIGTYPYQDIMSLTSYVFDGVVQGARVNSMKDKTLQWETTAVTDLGFDMILWNGLLSLTADWYKKVTDGILYSADIPKSIGLGAPITNFGGMKNTGVELDFQHQNTIGEVKYAASFNLTKNNNEVTKLKAPSFGRTIFKEGLPINSWYLLEWTGIFQSQEEIDNAPIHPSTPKPGDLRFKDQNNDKKIDGDDRIVFDGAHPDFFYGMNFSLEWNNFDLSAFLQGVQGKKEFIHVWLTDPLVQGTPPLKEFVEKMWTPTNPSNITPHIYLWGYSPNMGSDSDYYLKDASYLRLKNLTVGYQVPSDFCQKIGMKSARLYLSGDNLFTFTEFPSYADPERTGGDLATVQPQVKIYTIGAKLKF